MLLIDDSLKEIKNNKDVLLKLISTLSDDHGDKTALTRAVESICEFVKNENMNNSDYLESELNSKLDEMDELESRNYELEDECSELSENIDKLAECIKDIMETVDADTSDTIRDTLKDKGFSDIY